MLSTYALRKNLNNITQLCHALFMLPECIMYACDFDLTRTLTL